MLHSNALRNCDAAFGNLDACKVTWWWWAWMMITSRQHWFKPPKALKLHYLAEYFENLKSTQRLPNLFQFFGNSNLVSKNPCRAFCPRNTSFLYMFILGFEEYPFMQLSGFLLICWLTEPISPNIFWIYDQIWGTCEKKGHTIHPCNLTEKRDLKKGTMYYTDMMFYVYSIYSIQYVNIYIFQYDTFVFN